MSAGAQSPLLCWCRSRYGFAVWCWLSFLMAWALLRGLLFFQFKPEEVTGGEAMNVFLAGLHRDAFMGLVYLLPLLVWFWIMGGRWFSRRWHRWLFLVALFVLIGVEIFLLAVEYFFFDEFMSRFNTVAVDYLLYPHEVFINIWQAYPVGKVLMGVGAMAAGWVWLTNRLFRGMWLGNVSLKARTAWLLGGVMLAAALSPTVTLKGANATSDRTLNEIANNGAISFVCAVWTRHLDYAAFYKTMPLDEAYGRVRRKLEDANVQFTSDGNSIHRRVAGDLLRPRLNVVIFLEESLGSEFWGCLGRKEETLMPEMDKLAAEEGLLFTNIYASGNRTVRGFEGVLSSFPPLPGDSIVKRDLSDNVETIARVLKRDGYSTIFLYGGRGIFDGMRSFALNNGYDRFIEQKHFEKPTFATIWGVCDEDLFARAIDEFRELSKQGKPFLGTVLSVSNHKPYTYPAGRIPEDPNERRRAHAVKYSDYALGQFFKAAKNEPFWTNTVFVVVADHGARVYGSQSIPLHSYEIPLVMLGPAVVKSPARIPALGGSLDVPATILGLVGRPYETLFFGRDLLRGAPGQERVFLNHNRDIGLYAREHLVVLGLKQNVEYYTGDAKLTDMKPTTAPTPLELELEKDAVAFYQVADDLYMHRRFRIDGEGTER